MPIYVYIYPDSLGTDRDIASSDALSEDRMEAYMVGRVRHRQLRVIREVFVIAPTAE
jgi:hypothetical protein